MSAADELDKLLRECGLRVKIGLRAQGHIPTIQMMLAAGKSWDDIGNVIGWIVTVLMGVTAIAAIVSLF